MELWLPIASALSFLAGIAVTAWGIWMGRPRPGRLNFAAMLAGFLFLTGWLILRGEAEGSCPINSLYDVLIFQSWSLVLIYLLVGTSYRLSLLGAFTAPLALGLLAAAWIAPIPRDAVPRNVVNPWIEAHAALSLLAYGSFGLACIAGAMYLVQERQLKSHRFSRLSHSLPPITHLAIANKRLLLLGLVLLSISFAAGILSQTHVNNLKFWGSAAIWIAYALLIGIHRFRPLPSGRVAAASVVVFVVTLLTLPAIQHLSTKP